MTDTTTTATAAHVDGRDGDDDDDDDALALLRFLALCTSVHADAVQSAVDDTRIPLLQLSRESAAMAELDDELATLQARQRRLSVLRDAVARAQRLRRDVHADGAAAHTTTTTTAAVRTRGHGCDSNTHDDDRSDNGDDDVEQLDEAASCDARVRRVQAQMRALDAACVKTRLRQLEALKRRARDVDGVAVVRRLVAPFRFSADVERLWCSDSEDDGSDDDGSDGDDDVSDDDNDSDADVLPVSASSSSSSLPLLASERDVDALLRRACARFTRRYADALDALVHADADAHADAALVFDCVLYANALLGHDTDHHNDDDDDDNSGSGRHDVAAVLTLQQLLQQNIQEHDDDNHDDTTVAATAAATLPPVTVPAYDCDATTTTSATTATTSATVLSPYESCALPMHWSTARMLAATPTRCLLPPARHVLTPRFSFADVCELRALEQLRVQVQRRLVDLSLDLPRLMQTLMQQQQVQQYVSLASSSRPPLPRSTTASSSLRDAAVAVARITRYDAAANADSDSESETDGGRDGNTTTRPRRLRRLRHAWATVAVTRVQDDSDNDAQQ